MSRSQHALIAQIRLVMQSLTMPAPLILAVMDEVEHLDLTQVQLPIVEFSPFSTLSVPQPTSHNDTTERHARRVTPPESFSQSPRRQETAAAVRDTEDHPTPPVFSLRSRTGYQTSKAEIQQAQSSARGHAATVDSHEVSRMRQGIADTTDTVVSKERQQRVQFALTDKSQVSAPNDQADSQASGDNVSWAAFATQALSEIQLTGSSRESIQAKHEHSQAETGSQRQQISPAGNPATINRNGIVNSEVPQSTIGQHHPMAELSTSVVSHTRMMTQHVPVARMGSVSIPADRFNDAPTSQLVPPAESLSHIALDAEEIAALVNDILVEQARRNGVDLS